MMQRILFPLIVVTAGMLLVPAISRASDELEPIVRKDALAASDRARIETIVAQRAKKLEDAADKPSSLRDARDFLIATATVDKATRSGLDAYAEACASALSPAITGDKLALGLESIQVLLKIDSVRTSDALAGGLRSPFAAVRFRAASGLKSLHKQLASDTSACRGILSALGRAGAEETDEFALRAIYEAINFKADVPAFKACDEIAAALNEVFRSRLDSLRSIGRDEWKDIPGFEAAAACFKESNDSHRRELVRNLYRFLENAAERYAAEGTTDQYVPTLVSTTESAERALSTMAREGGASEITSSLSTSMKSKRTDASRKAVRDALKSLKSALSKTPWPVS